MWYVLDMCKRVSYIVNFLEDTAQRVCQCGHNRYPVPSYGGSSSYGSEHARCMYWACASEFHTLSTSWRTLHNVSPILKFCNKLPVWQYIQ